VADRPPRALSVAATATIRGPGSTGHTGPFVNAFRADRCGTATERRGRDRQGVQHVDVGLVPLSVESDGERVDRLERADRS
jgi:hypothetical protein